MKAVMTRVRSMLKVVKVIGENTQFSLRAACVLGLFLLCLPLVGTASQAADASTAGRTSALNPSALTPPGDDAQDILPREQARGTPAQGNTTIRLMGPELGLGGQAGWNFYDGGDAAAGAYMGWMYSGTASLDGSVFLSQTIPPGRYYVFLKGTDYDVGFSVTISLGGGQATTVTDDRDWNRYWTEQTNIDTISATDALSITLLKAGPISSTEKYLFKGLYLTDDPNEVVLSTDVVVDLTYPTAMDDSPAVKGNVLENSSFEAGIGHGWALDNNRGISVRSLWDPTEAFHGTASLKIPLDEDTSIYGDGGKTILSKVYTLKPNKRYTFSAWVKTQAGTTVGGRIIVSNTFDPPEGFPPQYSISQSFVATEEWQRVSVTNYLVEYPTADYQVKISAGGRDDNYLWLDAVQLEEGDLSNYEPKRPVEIALLADQPGNICYEDEAIAADLRGYNDSPTERTVQVSYEIRDYLNRKVGEGSQRITIPPNTTWVNPFDLSTGSRGIFRAVLWIEGEEGTEEEFVYSVVPRPPVMGIDEGSFMGIHPNFVHFQLEELQRLGLKWGRVLSPAAFFRWSAVEPVDDEFIWYDEEVQRAGMYGITILGTIGTDDYWPAWADNGGLPDLDEWEEFVGQIVDHYSPTVKYWEIWNEPVYVFTANFYAQMLKRAADAIEANDPDAKIVAMGGVGYPYMLNVIANLEALYPGWDWQDHLDVFATHCYPRGLIPEDFKPHIIDVYGVPVWNTETGDWDRGFSMGSNSNFVSWGTNLWPHADGSRYYDGALDSLEQVVPNFLRSIGSGLTKYFYYDSRIYAVPDYFSSHPTLLEYDDTIRSKGIAYAIAGHFVDHSTALGDLAIDPDTFAYLFDKNGTPLVALWTKDRSSKSLTVSLSPSQFEVYDVMGNAVTISASTIPYGMTPIYVQGQGVSVSEFQAALQTGTIVSRTDTLPPNVSISSAPRGPIQDTSLRVRWIAIDETSIPILDNDPNYRPEAILYSYRLSGYDNFCQVYADPWSDWSPHTFADYSGLPEGSYLFEVKAKDDSGNESEITSRGIQIRPPTMLVLTGAPANRSIHLAWSVSTTLPTTATWRIDYGGPIGDQPPPITGIVSPTRAYTLTGLTNYAWYTVTLDAMLGSTPLLADTVCMMPTDIAVYLPLVWRMR